MTLGESQLGGAGDSQLCAVTSDDNIAGSESSGLATNLDAVMKVLLELSDIQDLIVDWLCAVNDKLRNVLLSLNLKVDTNVLY